MVVTGTITVQPWEDGHLAIAEPTSKFKKGGSKRVALMVQCLVEIWGKEVHLMVINPGEREMIINAGDELAQLELVEQSDPTENAHKSCE